MRNREQRRNLEDWTQSWKKSMTPNKLHRNILEWQKKHVRIPHQNKSHWEKCYQLWKINMLPFFTHLCFGEKTFYSTHKNSEGGNKTFCRSAHGVVWTGLGTRGRPGWKYIILTKHRRMNKRYPVEGLTKECSSKRNRCEKPQMWERICGSEKNTDIIFLRWRETF